jgi:hypothetical protein
VFSTRSVPKSYNGHKWDNQVSYVRKPVCEEGSWAREAEESPLLEPTAREQLVKAQQAGKDLAGTVVIWEL